MGKSATTRNKPRHDPLYKELTTQGGNLRTKARGAKKQERDEGPEAYYDNTSSKKILKMSREQQEEIEREEKKALKTENNFSFGSRFIQGDDEDEDEDEEEDDEEIYENISDFGSDVEYEEEVEEIDDKDAALFEMYLQSHGREARTQAFNLGDQILASIREKEEALEQKEKVVEKPKEGVALPEKVIKAYTQVGQVLSTWTHGKLPKLFKVLPSLRNWEDVLYVTNPPEWTPHVVYEATKLFVSNLQSKQAEKFVETVLLERFRSDIQQNEDHSLNYHIYRALKKSLYKPGAFFKGFLFPLVNTGCSVREATIAGSVLSKVSIPAIHSSVALNYLLNMDFSPATTAFIRILLEKKYALPYQIIDNCVFYFMKFRLITEGSMIDEDEEERKDKKQAPPLPVVWHKAFLAFAQRYKNDITDDQRDFLLETVRQRNHRDIGPEIRRELLAGVARTDPSFEKEEVMADVF